MEDVERVTPSPPGHRRTVTRNQVSYQSVSYRYVQVRGQALNITEHYRIRPEDLCKHGRRIGNAKFVAVELACRLCGMTGREVGARYGRISSAAVSIIRRNIREGKYDVDKVVQRLLTKIRKDEARQT